MNPEIWCWNFKPSTNSVGWDFIIISAHWILHFLGINFEPTFNWKCILFFFIFIENFYTYFDSIIKINITNTYFLFIRFSFFGGINRVMIQIINLYQDIRTVLGIPSQDRYFE